MNRIKKKGCGRAICLNLVSNRETWKEIKGELFCEF